MERPVCTGKPPRYKAHPERVMMKAGYSWSGSHKKQNWRCGACGKPLMKGDYPEIKEG